MVRVGVSADNVGLRLDDHGRAVAASIGGWAVLLDQHRVVNLAVEREAHGVAVGGEAVRGELDLVFDARGHVEHELARSRHVAVAYRVRDHELRVGVERGPGPDGADARLAFHRTRDVAVLGVAKTPDLIALDPLAPEAAERLVLVIRARLAQVPNELQDRALGDARHAADRANRAALDESGDDLAAGFQVQAVHGVQSSAHA